MEIKWEAKEGRAARATVSNYMLIEVSKS